MLKSASPTISVITVTYNAEQHLENTIKSVLSQTYKDIEYIIIDGGSTDRTLDIIKKYENDIAYWISEPDKGISDAFNKGVKASSGDYVYFLGADDYFLDKSVVSSVVGNIDAQNDVLVCGVVHRVDEQGEVFAKTQPYFKKRDLLFKMALPHQGLFTHKSFFDKFGYFDVDNKFSMDYELLLRAYHDFPIVKMLEIPVAAWRDGGCGSGRFLEIFNEYHENRVKNRVAPIYVLQMINLWTLAKFYIKKSIGKKI